MTATFDIVIGIILVYGLIKGYSNGLMRELFYFFTFAISIFLSLKLTVPISTSIFGPSSTVFYVGTALVFIILFVAISFLGKMVLSLIKKILNIILFGVIDNFIGAIFGLFKWAFFISMITWFFSTMGMSFLDNFLEKSFLYKYVYQVGQTLLAGLEYLIPIVEEIIDNVDELKIKKEILFTLQK